MAYNLNLEGIAKVSEKANTKGLWIITPTTGKVKGVKDDMLVSVVGAYKAVYSEDTTLSFEDIAALMVSTGKVGDELVEVMQTYQKDDLEVVGDATQEGNPDIMAQLKSTLDKGKPAPKPGLKDTAPVSATGRDRLAIELGHKLSNDPDMLSDMREGYYIKERARILPVSIAWKFGKLYSKDEVASMPIPGEEEPKEKNDRKRNHTYDMRNGVGAGSWYGDLSEGVPWFPAEIGLPLEAISKRIKGEESTWPVKGEKALKADKAMYQTRKGTLTNQLRMAVALLRKIDQVAEDTDLEVTFRMAKDKDGKECVEHTTSPLMIAYKDVKKSREYTVMGVGSFMLVNVAKVAKATDQLAAFVAERGTNDADKEDINIDSIAKMDQAFSSIVDKLADDTGFQSALNKHLTNDNLEFIDTIFALKDRLVGICARETVRNLHKGFVAKQEALDAKIEADKKAATG